MTVAPGARPCPYVYIPPSLTPVIVMTGDLVSMVNVTFLGPPLFPALSVAEAVMVYVPVCEKVFEFTDSTSLFFHGKPMFFLLFPSFFTADTVTLLLL